MYKSTPITQKCKSSPVKQTVYTPPGVNRDLISGSSYTTNTSNGDVAVTNEYKGKEGAEVIADVVKIASQKRNPAQQARYEGRKERQSIRQKARAERIKAKNVGRAKSVQERVDNKNKYLNTLSTSTNIDQPVVNPKTGTKSYGGGDNFDDLEGKFEN